MSGTQAVECIDWVCKIGQVMRVMLNKDQESDPKKNVLIKVRSEKVRLQVLPVI